MISLTDRQLRVLTASRRGIRLVPANPDATFPRIGHCNSEYDCTPTCRLVQESPNPCPHGKTGVKWLIDALIERDLLEEP